MPSHTVELRNIAHWPRLKQVLAAYPLHDAERIVDNEGHTRRDELNAKILSHYWTREIGHETAELFTMRLHSRLMLIMPAYNELLASVRLSYDDAMLTTDMETTSTGDTSQVTDGRSGSTSTGGSRSGQYEHPQTQLVRGGTDMDGDYMSSEARAQTSTDTTGTATDTTVGQASTHAVMRGRSGSAAALLHEYRSTIINVDEMIVTDLATLFLSVWQPMRRVEV